MDSDYIYTGKDTEIDEALDPQKIVERLPHYDLVFNQLRDLQKITDEQAVVRNGKRIAGGKGGVKVIARLPEKIVYAILAKYPDFLRDEKSVRRILRKYKIYRAYEDIQI